MNVCILKYLVGVAHVLRVKQPPMHYTVNCSILFQKNMYQLQCSTYETQHV